MIRRIFPSLENYIKLKVKGKNIFRFLRTLHLMDIELFSISYPNRNEVIIKMSIDDYKKIKDMEKRYEVEMVRLYGLIKFKELIKINKYIIISLCFISFLIFFLSNLIFDIQVIHSNKDIRKIIMAELEEKGLKKFSFRKDYSKIQLIEAEILKKHKSKIEWLEIERIGTKYIIRVEERKLASEVEKDNYQHIIAKRGGVIKKIESLRGEIIRNINEYVPKGEIIISGQIKKGEEVIRNVKALGKVYAEVWYNIRVEYPLAYQEEYLTGKDKKVLVIDFLNYKLSLFDKDPFKEKRVKEKRLLSNRLLPIKLGLNYEQELRVIDEVYSKEEAIIKANEIAKKKVLEKLKEGEKIISHKNLKVELLDNKIIVEIFFSVYENIAMVKEFSVE
ncbi:MAG: sporulation protein YqfD [Bacilli bacterium]|nr:sporulation protein YqfD [Bacilli bacterium]